MIARKKYRRLRGALVAAGVSQDDLATILKMSPSSISNRFRGQQDWRASEMYAVLRYLGIQHPDAVLGEFFPPDGMDMDKEGN